MYFNPLVYALDSCWELMLYALLLQPNACRDGLMCDYIVRHHAATIAYKHINFLLAEKMKSRTPSGAGVIVKLLGSSKRNMFIVTSDSGECRC